MSSTRITSVSFGWARLVCALLLLSVLSSTTSCDPPKRQPAATVAATPAAPREPLATKSPASNEAYSMDTLRIKRNTPAGLVVQAAYPRLRPQDGAAPADTVGIQAFNQAAQAFINGLVKEMEAVAPENHRNELPTELQVRFRPYLLQQGLVSVAFTIDQDGIGPHPETWATGLTYDLRTGRKVQPADLFQQSAAFKALVINTLKPKVAGIEECEVDPNNLVWDNFSLGADAYYLLLGDAQLGRACETRVVRVPLAKLQSFMRAGSLAARLR